MLNISQYNYNRQQVMFNGHAARRFGQVMDNLYYAAYIKSPEFKEVPNVIKVSTKIEGQEISGLVSFNDFGHYVGLELPKGLEKLRSTFCKTIIDKYNQAVTKGKADKSLRY